MTRAAFLLIPFVLLAGTARADDAWRPASAAVTRGQERIFSITSDEPLKEAYILLLPEVPAGGLPGTGHHKGYREAEISSTGNGSWTVKTVMSPEDMRLFPLAAVIAKTVSGRILTLPVARITGAAKSLNVQLACPSDSRRELLKKLSENNEAELLRIIQAKKHKIGILRKMLTEKLSPQIKDELAARERSYGFSYETPLSAEMPAKELAFRITALDAAKQAATTDR